MHEMQLVLLLVAIAAAVATFAHRLRVPAPSLLVVAGVVLALLPGVPDVEVAPELISVVVLPPLLYAAGQDLPWRELRLVWRPVTVLAIGLVAATAAAVALVASEVTGLSGPMALVLGAVLASTDPVAVTALGRRLALPPRLHALLQAESLFNDATSLVLFRVTVAAAIAGSSLSFVRGSVQFIALGGGGVLIGAAIAGLAWLIRRRTVDPVLDTVIALLTPYAGYVLAENIGASGVTAVVVSSVILASRPATVGAAPLRLQVHAVYETVVFLLESVVFALIGLELPTLIEALPGHSWSWIAQAAAIAGTLLAIRALWIFPLWLASRRRETRGSWRHAVVASWAGARGVLPLAAALSIPLTTGAGAALPGRDLVLLLTTAVIVMTLTVQGFTLGPLVKRARIAQPPETAQEQTAAARVAMAQAALRYLDGCEGNGATSSAVDQLRTTLQMRIDYPDDGHADQLAPQARRLRRDVIMIETDELTRLYNSGDINASVRRDLQHRLDLEHGSLDH